MIENDIQTIRHRLRDKFIKNLPQQVNSLEKLVTAFVAGELKSNDMLYRAAHHLKGAAETHYLMKIAEVARELERMLANLSSNKELDDNGLQAIHKALVRLTVQADSLCSAAIQFSPNQKGNRQRIVIIDNDSAQANWLCSQLEQASFRTEIFNGFTAFQLAFQNQEQPAAIIADINCLEDDNLNSEAMAEIKTQCLNGLPMIFLSARQDMSTKLSAYRAGATRFLAKPVTQDTLLRTIAESVTLIPTEPYRVLLVENDTELLATYAFILQQAGMLVQAINDPLQASEALENFAAEILVSAMDMSQCSGPELAAILREDEEYKQLPVIYLSVETGIPEQLLALHRGADHFLTKPVNPRHLVATVALHARCFRQARDQSEELNVMLYEWKRQHQAVDMHAIVSVTDAMGNIIYVNDKFCEISGYSRMELLGSNHRILKSGEHSDRFFEGMWRTIVRGKIWQGEVCNKRKDGSRYWVKSSIVPFLDINGSPYQYISIRTDISRVKEAEQHLNILNRAIEASSSSISIADANEPNLPLIYVNPTFERITGYKRAEVLGRNARFLLGNDYNQPELVKIRAALREGTASEVLLRNYRKDGSLFWNKMRLAPVHDEQGKLTHFIGISEDVTQQKETESSRQEALDRLQKIASRIPGVVYQFRMRPDGHCCLPFTSDQTRELFRVNPEELIDDASKVFTVVHPSDYQPFIASIEASAREMTPWVHEFRTQYDDGSIRWLLGNSQPEREEDGSILWHGFITDISYQKNAERILKENSQHTQAILDNVVDGVITIDGQGIISTFNRAAQRIFGYTANEIIGENVSKLMPEPYRSKHNSYLKNYQNSAIKHTIGMDREVAGQRKDGAVFPMDLAVSEIQLDGKSLFIGLVRDISIRKQNESALLAAKNEAERANLAKSKFLSSVSHELRTPMNAVLGFSQLMEIDNTLPEEHKENVQEILKAGRHLMELIDEILDLAKIERGNIELSIETVILSDVVNDSITLVRQMADARGIQIACANCSDIVLRADYLRLKQGLLNLLSNAIKYNRINGQVQIDYERLNHNRVRIKVSDTGEGISQDLIGELFQPFNRLGAEGLNIHGTGIGLTITRQLIELMGGSVGVNTRYGIGSTFWIELPQDTKPIATLASTSLLTSEAVKNGAFNLLYVDDNVSELKQVVRLLSRYPHIHLMTAHTPKIGLDLASDMHFDLIMLEINMPVMDGFTFLNELRKRSLFAEIPVIAMTASSAQYDAERLNAAGFTDYLTKPIDRSHFFGILDTFWPLTDQNKEK